MDELGSRKEVEYAFQMLERGHQRRSPAGDLPRDRRPQGRRRPAGPRNGRGCAVTPPRRPLIGVTTQTLQAIDGIPAGAAAVVGDEPALCPFAGRRRRGAGPRFRCSATTPARCARSTIGSTAFSFRAASISTPPSIANRRHELLGRLDPARDVTELTITRWALEDQKPFLGLCRGLQVLSVALGGTLWQDITQRTTRFRKARLLPQRRIRPRSSRPPRRRSAVIRGSARRSAPARSRSTRCITRESGTWARGLVPTAIAFGRIDRGRGTGGRRFRGRRAVASGDVRVRQPPVGKLFEDFVAAAGSLSNGLVSTTPDNRMRRMQRMLPIAPI